MNNKLIIIFTILLTALVISGCTKDTAEGTVEGQNFDKDASYALGMGIAANFMGDGVIPDLDEFFLGMRDVILGNETRFDQFEAMQLIDAAFYTLMEKREEEMMLLGIEAMQDGIDFLVDNSRKPGVVITPTGLQYEVIVQGDGPKPGTDDAVLIHFELTMIDGTVFDSSYIDGSPAHFPVEGVFPGWTEGVQLMNVGSRYKFVIPQELGFADRPVGPIPPFSTLIFDVELLEIIDF